MLGVSESRVSQLHSQCAARLRSRTGNGGRVEPGVVAVVFHVRFPCCTDLIECALAAERV